MRSRRSAWISARIPTTNRNVTPTDGSTEITKSTRSSLRPFASRSFGLDQREQDGFANAEPGERHQQPVDTHTQASGRRHPVLHRAQEILVQPHRLVVPTGREQRLLNE